jgi:hypothetical protein
MTKKMCRIIGSSRNIVVVGTNSESIKAFSIFMLFASLVYCVALSRSPSNQNPIEHHLDAVDEPGGGKIERTVTCAPFSRLQSSSINRQLSII